MAKKLTEEEIKEIIDEGMAGTDAPLIENLRSLGISEEEIAEVLYFEM